MKKNSEYIKFILIGFIALVFSCLLSRFVPFNVSNGLNDLSSWYAYSFSKTSVKQLKFIGVEIDSNSLNKISQRWPWKRHVYARMVRILNEEKARAAGFDLVFAGESENAEDDAVFAAALKEIKSRVVLAYYFDYQKRKLALPLKELLDSAYAGGMVNTPEDSDRKVRRLRAFVEFEDKKLYSLAVQLSSAFLDRDPQDITSAMPLLKDKTFFINYLFKPDDIIRVSFQDVLENLPNLKRIYGQDFLKDALVLIYPAAEILHDTYSTPLDDHTPGGILHFNGVADIILNRFIKESRIIPVILLAGVFLCIMYFLASFSFTRGLVLVLGLFVSIFWLLTVSILKGVKFDFFLVVFFGSLFFLSGSIYKYIYFLGQLLKIKHKATLDPLRDLFTLRFFSYRLELGAKEIHFNKDLFLVLIRLEPLEEKLKGLPTEKIKEVWQKIHAIIWQKESFWALYSSNEIVGGVASSSGNIKLLIKYLENNLGALFNELDIKLEIKFAYLRFKKNYSVKELLFILAKNIKEKSESVVEYKDEDAAKLLSVFQVKLKESSRLLDNLGEDIEEKNRELLLLIDNLNKEYAKTKEVFFQVITSLVNALEARDPYTKGHSERVAKYAVKLADALAWGQEEKDKLKKAALLHDLGKIGIPDSILHKKGKLEDEEYDYIKKHEIFAVRILEPLKEFNEILPWILYHHERWDGKGYPHGLAGDAIPLASQIISIADVFDALFTGRDYKKAFTLEESLEEMVKSKGTYFNPHFVDVFINVIQKERASQ